jgi:glycosyltransferase involved in cell wall biosynthesis
VVAVSDNCSSDRTPDVVAEYRDRLQIVYHRNRETTSQRANCSVVTALCETPYITLLPDDDLLAPGQLSHALSAFAAHEGTVLVSAPIVVQGYPGEPRGHVRGIFVRATPQTSYIEPYTWDTTEWLALALARRTPSIIGAVFQHEAFRRCELAEGYHRVGDRLLLAEMGPHGDVLSLPWIGGYRRIGEHQTFHLSREAYSHEPDSATRDILDLCEKRNLPVLEFWVDQICLSTPSQQNFYLSLLSKALPPSTYTGVRNAVEERLGTKPARRLDRWCISKQLVEPLRAIRSYLSK